MTQVFQTSSNILIMKPVILCIECFIVVYLSILQVSSTLSAIVASKYFNLLSLCKMCV